VADKLVIYTLSTCPTCNRAKADLTADGVDFEERVIDKDARYWEEAQELAFTVPIILRDGKVEVGWKGESG
jgi:glutaredoxin